ncbi:MAG: cobalt transport protein [Lachnospiraceae bacterium]|nr:cobalt transport protein [Lachnospiraceae bacterium]
MRKFQDHNPIVVFIYFLLVTVVCVLCMTPAVTVISLAGAVILDSVVSEKRGIGKHLRMLAVFFLLSLLNPFLYHNGVTVLFVLNDNPITLEALLYGVCAALMVISVLYWFRSFSVIMTEDRLLYVFGVFSPKLALLFSMTLRYIPLFSKQAKRINNVQRSLGLYKEDNAIDSIRGGVRVFSALMTWGLENGIITADSMAARGYGVGKRTFYTIWKFGRRDLLLLLTELALGGLVIAGRILKAVSFTFYPAFESAAPSPLGFAALAGYALLVLLPTILDIYEALRWKYLTSKI